MLFFNKQYREEGKLFDQLAKKISKSKNIIYSSEGNSVLYQMDSIDIGFEIIGQKLAVLDKKGDIIVELDCKYAGAPYNIEIKLANARFIRFSNLLNFIREQYDKRQLNEKKKEQIVQATKKIEIKKAQKQQKEEINQAIIANAYQKIKSL